jgi:hypothetical protein
LEVPQIEVFGKTPDGRWILLANEVIAEKRPKDDLRRETTRSLKRAGIDYIVTPVVGLHGNAPLGKDLQDHAREYGIIEIGRFETLRLYAL